jgi:hypothetical protein
MSNDRTAKISVKWPRRRLKANKLADCSRHRPRTLREISPFSKTGSFDQSDVPIDNGTYDDTKTKGYDG